MRTFLGILLIALGLGLYCAMIMPIKAALVVFVVILLVFGGIGILVN